MDGSTNRRNEIILGDNIIIKYGSELSQDCRTWSAPTRDVVSSIGGSGSSTKVGALRSIGDIIGM